MILTTAHIRFWLSRRPLPKWTLAARVPIQTETVHTCINAHAGLKASYLEASNLISLLRLVRKRGECLSDYLRTDIAASRSWSAANNLKRHHYARRWLRKMGKAYL